MEKKLGTKLGVVGGELRRSTAQKAKGEENPIAGRTGAGKPMVSKENHAQRLDPRPIAGPMDEREGRHSLAEVADLSRIARQLESGIKSMPGSAGSYRERGSFFAKRRRDKAAKLHKRIEFGE
ncbi:MAG: hypothetical protein WA715_07680 [Candidatus Acidiferrum sp.]|jgi:hypothetical protein